MKLSNLYEHAQYCADLAEQAQRIADFGSQWQCVVQAGVATAMTPAIKNMQAIRGTFTPLSMMGLSQVENLVDTMRNSFCSTDLLRGIGAQWQLGLQSAIAAAMAPPLRGIQATAALCASAFSSQMLESLRQAQKMRFEMIDISDHFVGLPKMLRVNLKQFLCEQTAYYQAWLDMQEEYDAFTQAFVFCLDKMFCIALRMVRNVDDAKDVVQDAYEKAWKKLQVYSMKQIRALKIESWLSRIVKTTALNFLRDNGRCSHYEMDWMMQHPASRFDQPEANLIRKELLEMVYDSFKALPAIQHKVILMRYVDAEASLQEIADYLERPISTIKSDLRRGLLALQRQLTDRNISTLELEELVETLPSWPYTLAYSGHQT